MDCFLDEENRVFYHVWNRKPTSNEFRNGLIKVYENYLTHREQYPILHWLADTRNIGVLSIDDQYWLDKVWNELLFVKAKVKTHAVIIGENVFAKYAMKKFKDQMLKVYEDQNIHLDTFVNKEQAYDWFQAIEKEIAA